MRASDCARCFAKCRALDCAHLGEATGESVEVAGCGGCKSAKTQTAVFACELHGTCTPLAKNQAGIQACEGCEEWSN